MITLGLATVGGSLAFGAAANLEVESDDLGSGFAPVVSCDEDGVAISYTVDPDAPQYVATMTFSELGEDCAGQTLSWAIPGEEGPVASDSGIVDGPSVTFEPEEVMADQVDGVALTITGSTSVDLD